jgi:hypothetical protein
MSTSIKRIALVAVAALGLGVVSVAPSTAATYTPNTGLFCYTADGLTAGDTTTTSVNNAACGGVAGAFNYVTLRSNATADSVITVEGSTFGAAGTSWTVAADAKSATNAAATVDSSANGAIRVNTPAVGTITVKYWKRTAGVLAATASETVVITVAATASSGVYSAAESTAYIVDGETVTAITADETVIKIKTTNLAASNAAATIQVTYLDGLGAAIEDTLTATITGPGVLASNNSATDTTTAGTADIYTKKQKTNANGVANFFVFANGYAGTSTVTIKNEAGTVVATKSLTFFDNAVASITPKVLKTNIDGDAAGTTNYALELTLKDSAGNLITGQAWSPTIKSSATTIATAVGDTTTTTSAGVVTYGIQVVGAAYGPVTISFTDPTTAATASASFVVSSKVAATATVADVTVLAGDSISYTVKLVDAKGYVVPDGIAASQYISSIASVGGIATEVSTTDVKTLNGELVVKGVAPLISTTITSTFTLTGTAGTASSYFAKTLAGTKLTPKATVSNPASDAAIEAAASAEAAANEATDAALDAAEAADDATSKAQEAIDAVATLSAEVTKMINSLKAQIKTLSNLVAKIAKKVKA